MPYAEVSVNSPIAQRRMFSYAIPSGLSIEAGQAVWIPFGNKVLQGIVLELSEYPSVTETKEIAGIISPQPLLSPAQVLLARWLSDYYLCPLFDAVALMLPPGFERKVLTFISPVAAIDNLDISSLTPQQRQLIKLVQKQGKVALRQMEKVWGKKKTQTIVSQMVRRGLVVKNYELEPIKIRPKKRIYLCLSAAAGDVREEIARLRQRRAMRQAALLNFLAQQPGPVPLAQARRNGDYPAATVKALSNKGLVNAWEVEVKRTPIAYLKALANKGLVSAQEKVVLTAEDITAEERHLAVEGEVRKEKQPLDSTNEQDTANEVYQRITPQAPPRLTAAQHKALSSIRESLGQSNSSVFLLYGVTGSGKTEVYLRALAEAVKLGKRGIVLVPEIALTPQTIERFSARFSGKVGILHSKLSLGEQFDEWWRIRNGEVDVVIGSRSAIFAPQPELGLIVIDEEHEWTYKQDLSPRYHTRSVAVKLAELKEAAVILGSATPDVETYYQAQRGDYHLLELPERLTPYQGSALPRVRIVDLRDELKAGNRSIFSRLLKQAIDKALIKGEQVILFFNRRGAASFIQCRSCGLVLSCRRCQVALSYHSAEEALVCHQCNYRIVVPQTCPRCSSHRLKFLGIGTQKLEMEVGLTFPQAKALRWDSDATRGKHSHQEILNNFRNHKADILIGTQMVAKGLDIPLVTLVGVVSSDTSLNLPDFRAGEKTFQLLTQVAGRAGRGILGGEVIIQTYSPQHYAIRAAVSHDYTSFFKQEIAYRLKLNYPPFSQLARLIYTHVSDTQCQRETERMKRLIITERDFRGTSNLSLIGPAPAFIHHLRGRFRWQLILRGSQLTTLLSQLPIPQGWTVDVDPVGLA